MARIIIIGSIAEDDVVRLGEPLRAGAHIEGRESGVRLGGGGANTALPLARAGHHVALVSAVGTDAAGHRLLGGLGTAGVDTSAVVALEDQATTRSVIFIDSAGERTIINLRRTVEVAPPHRVLEITADWLYVRNRDVGLAPLLRQKAETCRIAAHIPPCAEGARPAHVLVGSASDLAADVLADPFAAGQRIAGDGLEWVVITRGERGVIAHGPAGLRVERAAPAVTPIDTTGAGDSFAAGLIHALASGRPMEDALAVAITWGAESVLHEGSHLPEAAMARLLAP